MRKLYDKIFSIKFFKLFLNVPVLSKLLTYEMLSYLFFGVMTTVVNLCVFYVSDKVLGNGALADFSVLGHIFKVTFEDVSTLISWIFAVLFAYITNKLWVFESKSWNPKLVIRELTSFFGARIVSFVVFESLGFMLVRNILININVFTTDVAPKWIAKIFISVFVVIFNYVMSKLLIFKKKKEDKSNESQGN